MSSSQPTAIVFGIANKRSIAWGVTQKLHAQGVKLTVAYQGERFERAIRKLLEGEGITDALLVTCDVTEEGAVDRVFDAHMEQWGRLDHVVHSIAFAKREELEGNFTDTSRDGFLLAQEISAFSLIPMARAAKRLMSDGGSIIAMTYLAAQRVVANYNVMGSAKASLEHVVRQLAFELGEQNIRVNAVSAGPLQTVSARGVAGFSGILKVYADKTPLKRNITLEEVANASWFLLSEQASGITGQCLFVDSGYSIMASSGDEI
ncbi:MAG: enoyl-ACP reductase [Acidobacteriota bacterium]